MTQNKARTLQVGQGHRAVMINAAFRYHLCHLGMGKVSNWWDLWVQENFDELKRRSRGNKAMGALTVPQLFIHPVDTTDRFRGSARLHGQKVNDGEEVTDYIVLSFDRGWGYCNRIHTMVVALWLCSMHNNGVYIYIHLVEGERGVPWGAGGRCQRDTEVLTAVRCALSEVPHQQGLCGLHGTSEQYCKGLWNFQ